MKHRFPNQNSGKKSKLHDFHGALLCETVKVLNSELSLLSGAKIFTWFEKLHSPAVMCTFFARKKTNCQKANIFVP